MKRKIFIVVCWVLIIILMPFLKKDTIEDIVDDVLREKGED